MNFNDLTNRERAMMWYQANPGGGGETYPTVLDDGNTVAWFDYTKGTTIVTGVSKWEDQSGNGNDLLQAATGRQPSLTSDGVLFNGSTDFLKASSFTLEQPEFIYMLFRIVTWTLNTDVFDGNTAFSGELYMSATTPDIKVYAGMGSSANSNMVVGTFAVARVLINGASSKIQINDTTSVTGNFGAADMNGFTIGASGGGSRYSNIEIKEAIIRKVADNSTDQSSIYNYLAKKI